MVALMRVGVKRSVPELAEYLQPKCGEKRQGYCDESYEDWAKCPLGKVRPHKSTLFELYARHGSHKLAALGEQEFEAVEQREQLDG